MSGKAFVDTNILVYAYDRLAGLRHERALRLVEQLWEAGNGVLSTQVLQELCVTLQRKVGNPPSIERIREVVHNYLSWQVVVNTPESVLRALDIEERHKVSFWDALILQAAESAGADVVYSEDLSEGQRYGDVRVVNPLLPPSK
jgi:predicted nucleic acid-binding protein